MAKSEAVDLTNCDREPIHIPGSIQPHGCLLACDAAAMTIRRHSTNAAAILDMDGDIKGCALDDAVGDAAAQIRNALSASVDPSRPGLILGLHAPKIGARFDVAVHASKANAIIEFERSPDDETDSPLELVRTLVGRLRRAPRIEELFQSAARLVRAAFGYDRVMIYRFAEDGSGQVINEARRPDLESFLGQYFPASDIPQQARKLYLQNTIRVIADASGKRVPIDPVLDASGEPLDLSFAHLRSVSPIHCEYLRNMGVSASMSISIISGGKLWGLVACHHYSPRVMSMSHRVAGEMLGEFFSLHLEALLHQDKLQAAERARTYLDGILRSGADYTDVGERLRNSVDDLKRLLPCDGVGLWMQDRFTCLGVTPPEDAIPIMADFMNAVADGKVWATNTLSERLPSAVDYCADASGVLAIPLSQIPRDYLFFFRRELVHTLNWAGDPNKTYEIGPLGDRLTPRKSFAIWKQTVERQSSAWTRDDREIAEATRIAIVEVALRLNETLADERQKASVRQKVLNEELNHRVKNILALIKSLVSQPLEAGKNLESYVASLKGRIQALALAHDQIIRGDGGGALADLLRAELSPYRDFSAPSAADAIEGEAVALDARAFSVMALVFHELATNAAKYGALSRPGGKLSVAWRRLADENCEIVWRESGGPVVTPPSRRGFGSVLIERSIPFDLGGESDIRYERDGLRARILIPAKFLTWMDAAKPSPASDAQPADERISLAGKRVLLVEDQLVIALDAEAMLFDEGVAIVETCASADEALRKLTTFDPDIAVLDINLGSGTSEAVAKELKRRSVPFIIATGYNDGAAVGEGLAGAVIARKPYTPQTLVSALLKSLEPR